MVRIAFIVFVSILSFKSNAQDKFFTKTGKIEFFSVAKLEDIEAVNKTVAVVLDAKTGDLQFSVLMKGFEFEKALMQEHFNSNYIESDKFPKATFKGTVDLKSIDLSKNGNYQSTARGILSMHGVEKNVEVPCTLIVNNGKISSTAVFNLLLSDYNIKIPGGVKNKVSNKIKISVSCLLEGL